MNMNQRIRRYIEDHGMRFTFVAERSGFDIKKFSRFMNDKQKMTTDEYEAVCKGLNVEPGFFFQKKFLDARNSA